ncbi:hypothetical protein QE152_g7764 [Popillia japonica]|uniref:Uncharacterized protein n=1 Tax=Popillia japonica TaxID=7064 RepID=A0AAW1ME25_POPJA
MACRISLLIFFFIYIGHISTYAIFEKIQQEGQNRCFSIGVNHAPLTTLKLPPASVDNENSTTANILIEYNDADNVKAMATVMAT